MSEPVSLADQISCVAREIALRENVYPKFVRTGRLKQEQADTELDRMRAVIETLKHAQAIKEPLRRAVELLCEIAEETKASHTIDGEWDGTEPEAQADHEEMIAIAEALSPVTNNRE